jgi:uncharacterized protein YndB with AHSA1/START domain
VTYDLTIERLLDAPPDLVFDTIVDPAYQEDIFADLVEGWTVRRFEIDLRVGGTWTVEYGPRDGSGPSDMITNVFTQIDRPRRLDYDVTMFVSEWDRTVTYHETIAFEDQGGKTLVSLVESGFETEADRDAFESGTPTWLESVQRVAEARAAEAGGDGAG